MCSAWQTKLALSNCYQSQFNGFRCPRAHFTNVVQAESQDPRAVVVARALRRFQLWPI